MHSYKMALIIMHLNSEVLIQNLGPLNFILNTKHQHFSFSSYEKVCYSAHLQLRQTEAT